jgi:hypothetical protein
VPSLHVLVRTPEQLEAVLPLSPASITLDYLELYGFAPVGGTHQGGGHGGTGSPVRDPQAPRTARGQFPVALGV